MVDVTRTFDVATPLREVLDYLKNFANAEEWDPGTLSCDPLGDGPVAVGSRWHNVSKIAGVETELDYELTRLEPGRVVFVGRNDTATSTDDISLVAAAERPGTTITYHATIEFHGAAKLAAPLAKVAFEKVGADTEKSLVEILGAPA
jgi:carbon monoxide dehydrogenase subunit G